MVNEGPGGDAVSTTVSSTKDNDGATSNLRHQKTTTWRLKQIENSDRISIQKCLIVH